MLVVRSDNCQNQYSADLLFFQMKKLAIELGIKIIWLCGELVDGLGLANTMLPFGWKSELRSEIITNDSWFESAEQMGKLFRDYSQSDGSKKHFLVNVTETAKIWKQKQGEFKIEPCSLMLSE